MINALCVCCLWMFVASWSEFKSWLSEKKRKPESALYQVEQQKLQHVQQLVGGTPHLWSEAVRWSEPSSELRGRAIQVFQLQVRLLGTHFQLLVSMTLANIRMCYSAFSCLLFSYLDNRGVLHPLLPKYTPLSMFQRLLHPHKSHGMQSWSVFTNYYQTVIHMQVYSNQLCNSDTHGG